MEVNRQGEICVKKGPQAMDESIALFVFVILEFLVVAAGMVLTIGCLRKNKKPRCGGQRINELCGDRMTQAGVTGSTSEKA